jgi:hypothetical protein
LRFSVCIYGIVFKTHNCDIENSDFFIHANANQLLKC